MKQKSNHIQNLILEGEHQQLDFKFEISDAQKIAKTFVAFANTDGGTLLIGVKDNGDIAGIRSGEERFMAKKASENFCDPVIDFTSKEWRINNKVVLEIFIPPGANKPYYALDTDNRWLVYVRVNDQNILANRVLVEAWKRKYSDEGTYINYTENEKLLLEYLEENDFVTLSEFKNIAAISNSNAQNILINFLALDIITVEVTEKEVFYKLAGDN
ncbi:MAG: ATP-binding protein [Bacteroidales bacterium]|nr:ATP-binding protein [Bacteroidales bacterium]